MRYALRSFGIASEDALALSLLIGFISLLSLLPLLVPSLFYRNQAFFKKTRAISLGGDFE